MFKTGDYIVHGNVGICKVENVGPIASTGVDKKKIYYTLIPCFTSGNKMFTPADSTKITMRPVISKQDAKELIQNISDIKVLWIQDERGREADYKEAYNKCNCYELVRIIKTIYIHKQERIELGKKTTAVDDKYFKLAQDRLYSELAISLEMDKEDVEQYIISSIEKDR